MSAWKKSHSGFTLIEVMVALAVLALSGIALLAGVNQVTRDLSTLNDKVVALNIAEYTLNTVLIKEDFPEKGRQEDLITFGDREWRVEVEISDTPNERVRRVDVRLQPGDISDAARERSTVLLSGFATDL